MTKRGKILAIVFSTCIALWLGLLLYNDGRSPASASSPCGDDPTGQYKAACQAEVDRENYSRRAEAMGNFSKSLEH